MASRLRKVAVIVVVLFSANVQPTRAEDPLDLPLRPPLPTNSIYSEIEDFRKRRVEIVRRHRRNPLNILKHPIKTLHNCTYPIRHPLETGKWMEESGFNGLMAGLGAIGGVATPFVVGAFR